MGFQNRKPRGFVGRREQMTGHNFPSEGWGRGSGSSVTWFRRIGEKRFMFTVWIKADHKTASYVQCMDVTGRESEWHTRHHMSI